MNATSMVLVATATLSSWLGFKSVETEIVIDAKPEQVWAVLTDFEQYSAWNKVMVPLSGELKEGQKINYEFHQDAENISEIPATVEKVEENLLINQKGGITGVLTFDHKYLLEEIPEGTKLTIYEEYTGIYVNFWDPEPVKKAYERLAEQIKARTEALASGN